MSASRGEKNALLGERERRINKLELELATSLRRQEAISLKYDNATKELSQLRQNIDSLEQDIEDKDSRIYEFQKKVVSQEKIIEKSSLSIPPCDSRAKVYFKNGRS